MQEITFTIQRAMILTGRGADKVIIHTGCPSPCPNVSSETLSLDFSVEYGKGYGYLVGTLGIDPGLIEVIELEKRGKWL